MSKLTEEMERCKDPKYFFINYWKIKLPNGDVMTAEQKERIWTRAVEDYYHGMGIIETKRRNHGRLRQTRRLLHREGTTE